MRKGSDCARHTIVSLHLFLLLWLNATPCGQTPPRPGTLDQSFAQGLSFDGPAFSVGIQYDGRVVVAGYFARVNGEPRSNLARFLTTGGLDGTFRPPSINGHLHTVSLSPTGEMLVTGEFGGIAGYVAADLARLNKDGSLDLAFKLSVIISSESSSSHVDTALVLPSGKILISGDSNDGTAHSRTGVARLLADGSLDTSFVSGDGTLGHTPALVVGADEKIYLGGVFNSYNRVPRRGVARLLPNGQLDTAFDPGDGPRSSTASGVVFALALQADGRVLVGGRFTSFSGYERSALVRLNSDGTVDGSFDAGNLGDPGRTPEIRALLVQTDGKILAGGLFNASIGNPVGLFTRLNTDGSADTTFTQGAPDGQVSGMAQDAEGRVLAAGYFKTFGGQPRQSFARVHGDFRAGSLEPPRIQTVERSVGGAQIRASVQQGCSYTLEKSLDFVSWRPVMNFIADKPEVNVADTRLATSRAFYRLIAP